VDSIVQDGIDFLGYKKADDMINAGSKVLAAHNRWATRGKVNAINAHPFTFGDITGMHNGTLKNQSLLPDSHTFTVDSENIFWSFNKIGVDDTIKKLHGAYALVWYEEDKQTINFVRNNDRPLSYCYSIDNKTIFWASEALMLELALHRQGVKHNEIVSLPIHTLMSVEIPLSGHKIKNVTQRKVEHHVEQYGEYLRQGNVHRINSSSGDLYKIFGTEHEFQIGELETNEYGQEYFRLLPLEDIEVGGKDLPVQIFVGSYSDMKERIEQAKEHGMYLKGKLASYADRFNNPSFITVQHNTVEFSEDEGQGADEDAAVDLYMGFDNEMLDEKEWKKATKLGCSWCASPANPSEDNFFISSNEFFCPECASMDYVKQYIGG